MAFSLSTNLAPLNFSSAFSELAFNTDLSSARFSLLDNSTYYHIWEATLYAYNKQIVLYDICSIMELYMRQKGFAHRPFRIVVKDGENTIFEKAWGVIYCNRRFNKDVAELSTTMFLSTIHSKMSFVGSIEQVARYAVVGKDSTEHLEVIHEDTSGKQSITSITRNVGTNKSTGAAFSIIDYPTLLATLNTNRILSVMLTMGKRTFTFYYGTTPTIAFLFRNAFNVIEVAPIFGTIKRVTEVSRSTATCHGIDSFYDKKDVHSYEVETADLPYDKARWLEQLCTSHEVWLYVDGIVPDDFYKVLITEHTCEVSDNDSNMNSLKFKFKFPDGRSLISDINPQSADDIFSFQYQSQFS